MTVPQEVTLSTPRHTHCLKPGGGAGVLRPIGALLTAPPPLNCLLVSAWGEGVAGVQGRRGFCPQRSMRLGAGVTPGSHCLSSARRCNFSAVHANVTHANIGRALRPECS